MEAIARFFRFDERATTFGTEARAGLTTFMVMAYIIFVNPNVIARPLNLDPVAVSAGTALIAGIMTIAMGVIGNYPFAIAAGAQHRARRKGRHGRGVHRGHRHPGARPRRLP